MQQRVFNLGKALVQELGLEPGVDTLARWMAHYVAEQMELAKSAAGDAKREAEQRCFETILTLWDHQSSWPSGRRPFESFESILRTLERLDPENRNTFFYRSPVFPSPESGDTGESGDEVQQWLALALQIDEAARVLIEFVFQQAALAATNEKTIEWTENLAGLPTSADVSIIVHLAHLGAGNEHEEAEELENRLKKEKLMSRIGQLDVLIGFGQELRAGFVNQLENLTQNSSSADATQADSQQ
jgi:hypothetical protein